MENQEEGSDQNGKGGDPCLLKLPLGTEVRIEGKEEILCELLTHGEEIVLLKGARVVGEMPLLNLLLIKHQGKQLKEKPEVKGILFSL